MKTLPSRRRAVLSVSLLLFVSLAASAPAVPSVMLLFDPAGRADNAINQSASDGLDRVVRDSGIAFGSNAVVDADDALTQIRDAAKANTVVVAVGGISVGALTKIAKEFPKVKFIGVDSLPSGLNTAGLRFREHEGGFLAGALAGKASSTQILGVVGAGNDPVTIKYRAGFIAGVKFVCGKCTVLTANVTKPNDTFGATTITKGLFAKGADIVLAAAGSSSRGVVSAAGTVECLNAKTLPKGVTFKSDMFKAVPRSGAYKDTCKGDTRPVFAIGTESNMNRWGDTDIDASTLNHTLTSVVKRADNAVYAILSDIAAGRPWRPGERGFALQNGGIELVIEKTNRALITPQMEKDLGKIQKLVTDGVIKVPVQ
ncbi:BMP family lipoprotein [Deinococcus puniceus]|uniref:ABC transporter substrate-binding protein PnrA-like domain-containing protein n=1 Tax=Deinococcus puniceus TaxID=1182568 RepID=A0A172T8A4_9DEIO|nr:BMP family ABC transporter substrate-binding protein [Deinococcus puniceus]ANE43176.1 hypothetical protein SU48_04665 [Deinococcus puniceus]